MPRISKVEKQIATREDVVGRLLNNGAYTGTEINEIANAAEKSAEVFAEWKKKGGILNYAIISELGTVYFGQSKNIIARRYNVGRIYEEKLQLNDEKMDTYKYVFFDLNDRTNALFKEEQLISKFKTCSPEKGTNVAARSIKHVSTTNTTVVIDRVTKYDHAYSFVARVKSPTATKRKFVRFSSAKQAIEVIGDEEAVRSALKKAKIISKPEETK